MEQEETHSLHEFLDYRRADVHFVYSFLWKASTSVRADVFSKGLGNKPGSDWKSPPIHERIIGEIDGGSEESTWLGAYQPNFVFERRCIEFSGNFSGQGRKRSKNEVHLVVPMKMGAQLPRLGSRATSTKRARNSPCVIHPILAAWTMRLFDSGAGTFTVRLSLEGAKLSKDSSYCFSLIHWLLRLTPNLDAAPEAHSNVSIESAYFPIVDSFVYSPAFGTCRLFELMLFHRDTALRRVPSEVFEKAEYNPKRSFLYADEHALAYKADAEIRASLSAPPAAPKPQRAFSKSNWRENQTPFVFITAITQENSLAKLREPSSMRAKEVGSLCAKLTLDNRQTLVDFQHLSTDYLVKALNYDQINDRLISLSHDDRLFFTFSKRGAVAISAAPNRLPALFVIPSLLNLFELAKARLHSGIVLGVRLAELANRLATMKPDASPIDEVEYAHLRRLVVLNLQNPLQYLFDGGSVTELALVIEKTLFVNQIWRDVQHSFEMVDRLVAAWETIQLRSQYEQSL